MGKKILSKTEKNLLSPKELQDKIFRQMSASKKLRLASKFSSFLLKLNQLNRPRTFLGSIKSTPRQTFVPAITVSKVTEYSKRRRSQRKWNL